MDKTLLELITDLEGYLAGGMTVEMEHVRVPTRTGRPAGEESILDKVANLSGRDLSKGKAG